MGVVVTFNFSAWQATYPEFSNVTEPQAQNFFNLATIYCRNDGGGPVNNLAVATTLLNLLVSHFAFLAGLSNAQNQGGNPSPLVGRVTNASEGSVSVAVELPNMPAAAAFFSQTSYGLQYWAATAPYRTMRYMPGPQRNFGSPYGGYRGW